MPTTYTKSGVQGTSVITSYATLYTVPSSTVGIISTIAICNTAGSAATYRIGFSNTAGTPGASEWLVYGSSVSANDTVFLTLGISLPAGTSIRVSSSADTVSFQAFVSEIS